MELTIRLPEELAERLRHHTAAQGEDMNRYAVAALREVLDRDLGRIEGQKLLNGPAHPFDLEEVRRKAGLPPGRTTEEIAEAWDAAIEGMTPQQRANAERLGIL